METNIINNKIRLQQLALELLMTTQQQQERYFDLQQAAQQKRQAVQMAIQDWKYAHVLLAPCIGNIVLPYTTLVGASVEAGAPLLTITPKGTTLKTFVQAQVPKLGIGKLRLRQHATIFLDNYPSSEYGTLRAQVSAIADLPKEEAYTVTLKLLNGWQTNYGMAIPEQQNLSAQVVIETKEYSLLKRMLSGLLEAVVK